MYLPYENWYWTTNGEGVKSLQQNKELGWIETRNRHINNAYVHKEISSETHPFCFATHFQFFLRDMRGQLIPIFTVIIIVLLISLWFCYCHQTSFPFYINILFHAHTMTWQSTHKMRNLALGWICLVEYYISHNRFFLVFLPFSHMNTFIWVRTFG